MGFAAGVVKYLVFLANLVFALAGLALIIIGVVYKLNYQKAIDILPSKLGLAPTLFIIIGSIVFITAFLGCCGSVRESTCMLTTYAIILLTIFIIQIAIGVYVFLEIKDSNHHAEIRKVLDQTFSRYGDSIEMRETTDLIQKTFECCGVRSSDQYTWPNGSIPSSCCRNNEHSCSPSSMNKYETGCADAVIGFFQRSIPIIGGVAIGIAATEIIGAVFGLCLASSIRNSYRRGIYA